MYQHLYTIFFFCVICFYLSCLHVYTFSMQQHIGIHELFSLNNVSAIFILNSGERRHKMRR